MFESGKIKQLGRRVNHHVKSLIKQQKKRPRIQSTFKAAPHLAGRAARLAACFRRWPACLNTGCCATRGPVAPAWRTAAAGSGRARPPRCRPARRVRCLLRSGGWRWCSCAAARILKKISIVFYTQKRRHTSCK